MIQIASYPSLGPASSNNVLSCCATGDCYGEEAAHFVLETFSCFSETVCNDVTNISDTGDGDTGEDDAARIHQLCNISSGRGGS